MWFKRKKHLPKELKSREGFVLEFIRANTDISENYTNIFYAYKPGNKNSGWMVFRTQPYWNSHEVDVWINLGDLRILLDETDIKDVRRRVQAYQAPLKSLHDL